MLGRANIADDRGPRVHSGPETRPAGAAGSDLIGGGLHGERSGDSASRMIRLFPGRVEDDYHGVSGEPLDQPAVVSHDDRHGHGPVGVQHPDHVGRVGVFAEGCEALQIGEEHADVPRLSAELSGAWISAQALGEGCRNVRAVEAVDRAQLSSGALQECGLIVWEVEPGRNLP
jgi:hypothetical protein